MGRNNTARETSSEIWFVVPSCEIQTEIKVLINSIEVSNSRQKLTRKNPSYKKMNLSVLLFFDDFFIEIRFIFFFFLHFFLHQFFGFVEGEPLFSAGTRI